MNVEGNQSFFYKLGSKYCVGKAGIWYSNTIIGEESYFHVACFSLVSLLFHTRWQFFLTCMRNDIIVLLNLHKSKERQVNYALIVISLLN